MNKNTYTVGMLKLNYLRKILSNIKYVITKITLNITIIKFKYGCIQFMEFAEQTSVYLSNKLILKRWDLNIIVLQKKKKFTLYAS